MDIENWTGEINIKLSPFQDTTREFNYLDSKCQLSISRHVRINKEPTSIGKVKSLFTFEHSKVQPLIRIIDDFLALYDFISFANYNSNISFENIDISSKNEEGLFEKTATVHIFINKTEYENTRLNSITIDDIPAEKLSAIFTCIASLRKNDNRLRYISPKMRMTGNTLIRVNG